jgi:3-oxoacyl-[acyl-carrier protein] reductase
MSLETGLAGKVVIVTGAGSGIGRATARRFAQERALVAAWDVSEPDADAARELAAQAGDALVDCVDVSDAAAVAGGVARVVERWGRVDVLVNNAGILRDAQLVKWKDGEVARVMSDAEFDAVVDVNLRGPFLCTRAVVPHMIAAGGGAIINASSVVGLHGNFGQTNYVASKAGLIGMTRVWARELGRYRIRVNAIAPGFVDTAMTRSIPDRVLEGMIARTPLGRIGRPEELADAYVWLASTAASFVTGAVVSVDGGLVVGT